VKGKRTSGSTVPTPKHHPLELAYTIATAPVTRSLAGANNVTATVGLSKSALLNLKQNCPPTMGLNDYDKGKHGILVVEF
jgi:hypothetical protein